MDVTSAGVICFKSRRPPSSPRPASSVTVAQLLELGCLLRRRVGEQGLPLLDHRDRRLDHVAAAADLCDPIRRNAILGGDATLCSQGCAKQRTPGGVSSTDLNCRADTVHEARFPHACLRNHYGWQLEGVGHTSCEPRLRGGLDDIHHALLECCRAHTLRRDGGRKVPPGHSVLDLFRLLHLLNRKCDRLVARLAQDTLLDDTCETEAECNSILVVLGDTNCVLYLKEHVRMPRVECGDGYNLDAAVDLRV